MIYAVTFILRKSNDPVSTKSKQIIDNDLGKKIESLPKYGNIRKRFLKYVV